MMSLRHNCAKKQRTNNSPVKTSFSNEQDLANNFSRLIEHDLIANTDDLIKHTVEKLGSNVPLDLSGLNEGQLNLFCDEMADKISDENGNTLKFNNLSEAIKSGITNSNGVFSTDNIQSVDVLHNGEIEHVNFVNINHTPSTPNLDMKFNMDIQNRFTSIVESGIFNDNTDFIIHSISELGMTANLDVSTLNNQELDLFAKTMAEQISIETGMSFNNLEESIKESILHHDNTFSMGNLKTRFILLIIFSWNVPSKKISVAIIIINGNIPIGNSTLVNT